MTILIWNSKGGVLKTSLTMLFSSFLSSNNKKVLIIDTDPQSSTSQLLGVNKDKERNLYKFLMGEIPISESYLPTEHKNIYIIPGNINVFKIDSRILPNQLSKAIQFIKKEFDYILIDTPSSYNTVIISSIFAADKVIIPTPFSGVDLSELSFVLNEIAELKPNMEKIIVGTRTTHADKLSNEEKEYVDQYKEIIGPYLSEYFIPDTKLVRRAFDRGESLNKDDESSRKFRQSLKSLVEKVTGEKFGNEFVEV
ncbi:ParA family protein [Leptospira licerasiae]|uniref:CobQ/CobB/MinD/ParA nucleotide binding domain protein n=1 Tax=Leptospira licerasiae str. MMD4847 TaxID=1049971 RepID=A0ABN0H9L6_9LEPT|nr:ParA family protein [Leptospira licerasiae]EIE01476.1 CobQ/CobB/MinD/ParA nucleotide binding domain protein [Leptospira licerasiae serovar Varillal str. VAR 010]EJZ42291.1 CobQ/CobB/MinD/ParA nucleotide binding domain protein [Leptospira licerasiae str. MMD4847]